VDSLSGADGASPDRVNVDGSEESRAALAEADFPIMGRRGGATHRDWAGAGVGMC
jgi:hypothetical protein